ncbi:MmcQ family protein, partial [Streptococcus suis]
MKKINYYKIHLPSLLPYGFLIANNCYTNRELFMDGQFEAVV